MGDSGYQKTKLHYYLIFVVLCIGVCVFNYYYNTTRFEASQQTIIHAFEKSMNSYNQRVPSNVNHQVETISVANQKHQEEVKALLELQFNKIQNEYETQEIWTGILTIVFLIFSFYSLFKSEEMERQGKVALHSIEESEEGAKKALGSIETDKTTKLNEIKDDYDKWIKKEEEKVAQNVGEVQSNLSNQITSEINTITEKLETVYRNSTTQYQETLKQKTNTFIEELQKDNLEKISLFIKTLEEKNAGEIQTQVDLWTSKMSELKSEYEKVINDIFEEHNPVQVVADNNLESHPDEGVEEPDQDLTINDINEPSDSEDELDEQ